MPPTSLSRVLGELIVREKEAHDLSRNPEFERFQFLGYRTSPLAVELVALCDADELTESDVVRLRDEFFGLVRRLPHDYGLKPNGRNPNGLLGFVFAGGCPEPLARFIARQTRVDHAAGTGGVSVAWAIDVPGRRIHTHDNPVSIFPPVIIQARTVYPGLAWMESQLPHLPDAADRPPPPVRNDHPVDAGPHPSPAPEAVRILFLAANSQTRPLDLDREWERIETNLRLGQDRDRVTGKPVLAASMERLMQALLDESPTIVHFSGHGHTDGIVMRADGKETQRVPGEALAGLFALFKDTLQCVVLNACWSEPQAQAIRKHVPYVVGTRARIEDGDGLAFSVGFYKAIAAGRDVRFAFRMGAANVHARGKGGEKNLVLLSRDAGDA
jgi:hypothetical protein